MESKLAEIDDNNSKGVLFEYIYHGDVQYGQYLSIFVKLNLDRILMSQ